MLIAVIGSTGVYGRHLIPRLVASGHRVRALVRTPSTAYTAHACGAEVHAADIFDEGSLLSALKGCDVAVNLATSLPRPGTAGGDFAANDRLRREGTRTWLRACSEAGVPRVLQQSIAMIHGGGGANWADETTFHPVDESTIAGAANAAARDMEALVTASALDWCVLRGGLFYGPGTGFDEDWFERARSGRLRLPGDGSDYVSLLHISDMAAATVAAIARWPSRQSLIVADDQPATWAEVFTHISVLAGVAPPAPGGRAGFQSFRVSNRRAKELLAWQPRYPDYRAGLAR